MEAPLPEGTLLTEEEMAKYLGSLSSASCEKSFCSLKVRYVMICVLPIILDMRLQTLEDADRNPKLLAPAMPLGVPTRGD